MNRSLLEKRLQEFKVREASLMESNKLLEIEKNQLEVSNALLEEKVRYLTYELYGRKSEKRKKKEEGPFLFNEAEMGSEKEQAAPEPETIEVKYNRRKGKSGRKPISDKLPRKEIIVDISEEEKTCACGATMVKIGEETSERLKIIPMEIEVERTIRPKYACKCCEGVESEGIHPAVKIAEVPPSILPKTIATPSLLTYILINKFCDGLPFYRQEKIFSRIDVSIKRANMCNWTVRAYEKLEVLKKIMVRELLNSYLIGIDETTVQVLNEPEKPPESKSYMWVFRGGTQKNPIILFHYDPSRKGIVPNEYLENYKGRIQTDGYGGYNLLGSSKDIIHVGCWAHARRKFVETLESMKDVKYDKKENLAFKMVELISELYKNENKAKEENYGREKTTNYRQEHSSPVLSEIKKLLDENRSKVLPQSKLGIAVKYTLSEWEKLTVYVNDGLIPIDNNLVENAIRPFVIGRKNWLFYDSQDGARASGFFYSLIETAKANGLEPYSYLNYIFEEAPKCKTESDYEKLLPMFVDRTKIKAYSLPTSKCGSATRTTASS